MKKKLSICLLLLSIKMLSTVSYYNTYVDQYSYGPACLSKQYVKVGFFTNLEINNSTFQIQRSTDYNFSWSIIGTSGFNGNFSGCGTCGNSQYEVTDYGPFLPGEVWYYRVKATSNSLNFSYHNLGSYTCGAPSTVNWINQVTTQVTTGSSPNNESAYIWGQESRDNQGVNISLVPTEISKIYLEDNNNKINFNIMPTAGSFVSIDVNVDNNGYSNLYSGAPSTGYIWNNSSSSISGIGNHNLKVKYVTSSSQIFYREYDVYVVPRSNGFYVDSYCNTIRVWKGSDPNDGVPLVFSEGFDAYNTKSEQYYLEAGKDLINCLLNKGFNIYIVNYNLNSQSLVNNAAIFQSAIRYVSSINNNKLVVATGMSMGGVINRYACAKAENDGVPLPISKFVSIDGPQQGAIISETLQDFVKTTNAANNDTYSDIASNNDAAKELLKHHKFDPTSAVYTNFFNQLNSFNGDGYPHLVEKIGVAFSTSQTSPYASGDEWLNIKIHTPITPDQHFYLSSEEASAGSFLPKLNKDPFIAGPNNYWWLSTTVALQPFLYPRVEFIENKYPSFIPHESALDLISGVSKFDKTITPANTGFHDEVPADIIEPLVNAIIGKKVYIQNKTYTNSRTVIASETIFAGNNVTSTQTTGDVNINSGANIIFKAGKEIQLKVGLNISQGANFAAIITPVQCDGSTSYQSRMGSSNNSNNITTLLKDSSTQIIYENSKISNEEVISINTETSIYPNPSEGIVYVKSNLLQNLNYKIYTIQNVLLKEGKVSSDNQVNFQELNSGIYLLEIVNENFASKIFKIVKE